MSMRNSRLLGMAGLFIFFSYADYGAQFVFQMIASRILTIEDYGAYSALASASIAFTLFTVSFPLLALRNFSSLAVHQPSLFRPNFYKALLNLSYGVLPFGAFALVLTPWLSNFFHMRSMAALILVIVVDILAAYTGLCISALQALRLYVHSSGLTFSLTILRVTIGIALVWLSNASYVGLFIGLLIAHVAVIGVALWILKSKMPPGGLSGPLTFNFSGWQDAVFSSVGMGFLVGMDNLLARHFFSPTESGMYAAASTAAKIVLIIASPLLNLVIPEVTHAQKRHAQHFRLLVALAVAIPLLSWATLCIIPDLTLSLLVGSKYGAAQDILPTLAGSFLCLNLVSLMNQYCFARHLRPYFYCLYGSSLLSLLMIVTLFSETPKRMATGTLLGSTLTAIAGALCIWALRQRGTDSKAANAQEEPLAS